MDRTAALLFVAKFFIVLTILTPALSRSTRWRWEAALAVLFAGVTAVVGGGALYFVFTMTVHSDPAAVPSMPGVHAERYSGAIEESRRLAHALLLEENLPGLSVAVARDGDRADNRRCSTRGCG